MDPAKTTTMPVPTSVNDARESGTCMDEKMRLRIEGRYDELKGRVVEAWGAVTDDDVRRADGQADQLVGIIKRRTGETAEAIEAKFDEILAHIK